MMKALRLTVAAVMLGGTILGGPAIAQTGPSKPDGCVKIVETYKCDAKGNCTLIAQEQVAVPCP